MPPKIDRQKALTYYSNPDLGIKETLYSSSVQFNLNPPKVTVDGRSAHAIAFAPTKVTKNQPITDWKGNIIKDEQGNTTYEEIPMTGEFLVVFAGTSNIIGVHPNTVEFD